MASIRAAVEARLDELDSSACATPESSPAVQPSRTRVSEHWRSASPPRRLAYIAASAAACLLALIAPIAMLGGGDLVDVSQDQLETTGDSTAKALAGANVPSKSPDDRSSKTLPGDAIARQGAPRVVPTPDPETSKSSATDVAVLPGPDRPADAPSQEQIASRRRRSELLQHARALWQLAKSAKTPGGAGVIGNVPPEVPAIGGAAGVELFPPLPAVEGRPAILLRDVAGSSFEDVCNALGRGQLPPAAMVWPEEFVNHFRYADPPAGRGALGVAMDAAECLWNKKNETGVLLRVTLRSGGAAGGEPDLPAAPLQNVRVELRFTPGVVLSYRLLACGHADAPAASGVEAIPGAKTPLEPGEWPAGRTVTLLYLLSVPPRTTIGQMESAPKSSGKGKSQPAFAPQRLGSLAWWCDGPQGTRNGGDRSLDYAHKPMAEAPSDLRLAASAAAFALALRARSPEESLELSAAEELARSLPSAASPEQKADLLRAIEAARKIIRH